MALTRPEGYQHLLEQISDAYTSGQGRAVRAVNAHLIETYWQVGRHIVEFEQAGSRHVGALVGPAPFPQAGDALHARGLAVRGATRPGLQVTAAAWLLFGPRPADRYPQCEILVDAHDGLRIGGRPKGQAGINAPIPQALQAVLAFVDAHTLHPRRVVGLNNLRLDEYPVAALREALVNAVAHRSYDDAARKIAVRLFSDRIEIASPGYPSADEDRATLALRLDLVVRERAPAGWKGDETRERTVQNAIYPLLDRDREATQALFDIIKNQPGY